MNKNKSRKVKLSILIILLLLVLTACVPGKGSYTVNKPAGFFSGIWHGWIAPFSLIFSFFSRGVRMYEPINTGFAYELGFYMAIISGFGGITFTRNKGNS